MSDPFVVIKPKMPIKAGWERISTKLMQDRLSPGISAWHHAKSNIFVLSAVEVADGLSVNQVIPQYHLSISRQTPMGPVRIELGDAMWTLAQFDAIAALEDNHGPLIRSFWLPVDQTLIGAHCSCERDEAKVQEGDFIWRPLSQENFDRAA